MKINLRKIFFFNILILMSIKVNAQRGTRVGYIDMNIILESVTEYKEASRLLDKNIAENSDVNSDVKETPTGLQYKVLLEGDGESPRKTDKVKVHYSCRLIDGSEFDSSIKRGEPSSFGLNQVIKGWTEGLQLMKVGSKFEFYIHPNLGYGARGKPPLIPSNSLLIFEIELIEIITGK